MSMFLRKIFHRNDAGNDEQLVPSSEAIDQRSSSSSSPSPIGFIPINIDVGNHSSVHGITQHTPRKEFVMSEADIRVNGSSPEILSNKGKRKKEVDGFLFSCNKHRERKDGSTVYYFKCDHCKDAKYQKVVRKDGMVVQEAVTGQHSCYRDQHEVETKRLRREILNRIENNPHQTLGDSYEETLLTLGGSQNPDLALHMPRKSSLQSSVQRMRARLLHQGSATSSLTASAAENILLGQGTEEAFVDGILMTHQGPDQTFRAEG
jgi:hypothetical protein